MIAAVCKSPGKRLWGVLYKPLPQRGGRWWQAASGIAVLDASDGSLLRETTGIGSVTDVVVADLIPSVPGLEIAARTDMDTLRVESLASGTLLSATTIGAGGGMVWSSHTGTPSLLVPLQTGHVVAVRFIPEDDRGFVPEAHWISVYLAFDPRVIHVTQVQGQSMLVAGGDSHGGARSLAVIHAEGHVEREIPLPTATVRSIAPWQEGQLLVAGKGGLVRIVLDGPRADVALFQAKPWLSRAQYVSTLVEGRGDAPMALVWTREAGNHRGFRLVGYEGTEHHVDI